MRCSKAVGGCHTRLSRKMPEKESVEDVPRFRRLNRLDNLSLLSCASAFLLRRDVDVVVGVRWWRSMG